MTVTVMFEWDEPQGSGPETVVDYYTIAITPSPLSPSPIMVQRSPLNATLNYNTGYTATITAMNCAGNSATFSLQNIYYGEFDHLT